MNYLRIVLLVFVKTALFGLAADAQETGLLNGTIIITLTSNDTIWLGADSRTSSLTDTGYTVNKKGMCKIYCTNDIIYAMAGHVRYVDNSFDFLKIMQDCIYDEKDFDQSMEQFQQRAQTEIESILKKFSRKSINTLIKSNKGSFLTVVAISFIRGEKKLKEMRFSIAAIENNWKVIYKAIDQNGTGNLRFVGHAANASAFVRDNNLYFGNGRDIPNKISELIELESMQGTRTVGMPADVISIYNGGYKWVINSGLCN